MHIINRNTAWMLPGQGLHYLNMGKDLYQHHKVFRDAINHCFFILETKHGLKLRNILYPQSKNEKEPPIQAISVSTCVTFCIEYALASILINEKIIPSCIIGYSIGEYVAACIAQTLSLDDALELTATRGKLLESLPKGKMLGIPMKAEQLNSILPKNLGLATVLENTCIVSGKTDHIDLFSQILTKKKIFTYPINVACAGHSPLIDEILNEFSQTCTALTFKKPRVPFISNSTGCFITDKQATNPYYWVKQMRKPALLSQGLHAIIKFTPSSYIEVGPGKSMTMQLLQTQGYNDANTIHSMLQSENKTKKDTDHLDHMLSELQDAVSKSST